MPWLQQVSQTLHPISQSVLYEASQSALAAAVLILGLVILLELRSVVQLRRSVDRSLARVFEQLDLLRFENQQLLEDQASPAAAAVVPAMISASRAAAPPPPARTVQLAAPQAPARAQDSLADSAVMRSVATAVVDGGVGPAAASPVVAPAVERSLQGILERRSLPSGEARLLASLAEARARRGG